MQQCGRTCWGSYCAANAHTGPQQRPEWAVVTITWRRLDFFIQRLSLEKQLYQSACPWLVDIRIQDKRITRLHKKSHFLTFKADWSWSAILEGPLWNKSSQSSWRMRHLAQIVLEENLSLPAGLSVWLYASMLQTEVWPCGRKLLTLLMASQLRVSNKRTLLPRQKGYWREGR